MVREKTMEKILDIRLSEKKRAQKAYQQSADNFEKVASQLYHLLKEKEKAEEAYQSSLNDSFPVQAITSQVSYLNSLKEKIVKLQYSVEDARNIMVSQQGKLTESFIEAKKYEKLIEFQKDKKSEWKRETENKQMDEISVTHFLNHRVR
ncbi:flagellar export protein FliJ [Sediminibacillus massiliensis]|uniref:flagellar export protein FliJ n=1 Tax=Sediminibacillus massiliensis TaxID=1926277 RepID=UPI0009887F59|nr:flagellar export protein FliJ [Sediminibacillus massiliensis]